MYCIPETRNWGDTFTPFLLKEGLGVDVDVLAIGEIPEGVEDNHVWREARDFENRKDADVFGCGSLLERIPNGFAGHVLGSGAGYFDTARDLTNVKQPFLLRGLLTAERCSYSHKPRFGDPAILASLFMCGTVRKKYRYGLVPHYVDKDHSEITNWMQRKGVLRIDIESGILNVINAIASCENIVSSSLHGLVIADSLGVPNKFIRLSEAVLGNSFKFSDYYSVYGEKADPAPTVDRAFDLCRTRNVSVVRKDVLDVFTEYAEGLK